MILDVPYFSQIKDTKKPEWKNKSCGITALKMVLDFYGKASPTIDELYQKGLNLNGYLENVGWYHHSLVNIAQTLGYSGITRSWNITKESFEKLASRGFTEKDIQIIERQQFLESIYTIKKELSSQHPVIISLPKGFKKGGSGHLVVLIGYDEEGFYVHDPYDQDQPGTNIKLNYNKFKEIFEKRAIFIYPIPPTTATELEG